MKKNFTPMAISLFLIIEAPIAHADVPWNSAPRGYNVKHDFFTISTKTPPAVMYVTDSQGRRTGINPAFVSSLDSTGTLLDQKNGYLCEIPLSSNDQQNMTDESTGQPASTTPTLVTILDGGNQTYTINLVGITEGVQNIIVQDAPVTPSPKAPQNTFDVFIQPNQKKQISVSVNTDSFTTNITRIIGKEDLVNDIKNACSLNYITSRRICDRLEKRAEVIQDALKDKRFDKAEELVKSFLHFLGAEEGDGDNDEDDHAAIKEPALSILIEDAKALLAQIDQEERHPDHAGHS